MKSYIFAFIAFGLLISGCKPHNLPDEVEKNECLDATSNRLTKTYNLKLLSRHLGGIVEDEIACWGISLMSRNSYTLEEVRPLAAAVISAYIDTINSNPLFSADWAKRNCYKGPPPPFSEKAIAIKLAFWDPYFDRYFYPYIAEVRFAYGKVNYYYADPETQKLMPPITETLEELFSNLYEEDPICL